ncbi:perilipin-2-like [Chaetodon trifascialis]|uniref:perilipin-2-like n=1 Tax=Chaetodon trifascialis TaxID=109706 RepID=UPI003996C33E
MPMNNNQKVQSAAARLVQLPVLRSACAGLSVLYADAKCRHAGLRSVCEGLESSVTALASPVLVKLEAHVSIANDVACKGLDWLEATFPVIHAPTEQVVAAAVNKLSEIQDALSAAAHGTVTWLMGSIPQAERPLVQRAVSAAGMGLSSALSMSEALLDRVLPPTEEDEGEAHLLEGFEAPTLRRSYPARLVSLTSKLCRRTCHMIGSRMQSVQVDGRLSLQERVQTGRVMMELRHK